jgi:hypothetical protein
MKRYILLITTLAYAIVINGQVTVTSSGNLINSNGISAPFELITNGQIPSIPQPSNDPYCVNDPSGYVQQSVFYDAIRNNQILKGVVTFDGGSKYDGTLFTCPYQAFPDGVYFMLNFKGANSVTNTIYIQLDGQGYAPLMKLKDGRYQDLEQDDIRDDGFRFVHTDKALGIFVLEIGQKTQAHSFDNMGNQDGNGTPITNIGNGVSGSDAVTLNQLNAQSVNGNNGTTKVSGFIGLDNFSSASNGYVPTRNASTLNWVALPTKASLGLANVDNTSDINKPVSTAQQTTLNAKENTIAPGTTLQYWRGDKSWQTLPIPINYDTSTRQGIITRSASDSLYWILGGNAVAANRSIGTTNNFHLPFITNGIEKMRIESAGNVGIGTTLPSSKLHVDGSVTFGQGGTATIPNQTVNFAFTVAQINATSVVKAIQTTANITYTIPNPTGAIGRILAFLNAKESTAPITVVFGTSSKSVNVNTNLLLIWNGTEWACPNENNGNYIEVKSQVGTLVPAIFDGIQIRWNAASDRIEMATTVGTKSIRYISSINYGSATNVVNGGAGVDGAFTTPLALSTTFVPFGDVGLLGAEVRVGHIWDVATSAWYEINIVRLGTTTTDGTISFAVKKIGITTQQIITTSLPLNITSGVISTNVKSFGMVRRAAQQVVTVTTAVDIVFDAVANTTNITSAATATPLTITNAGLYNIIFSATLDDNGVLSGSNGTLFILKNGVAIENTQMFLPTGQAQNGSVLTQVQCAVGDVIKAQVQFSSTNNNGVFSAKLVATQIY